MDLRETKISGCYELTPKVFTDVRGTFVKTFHEKIFQDYGLVLIYQITDADI